MKNFEARYTVVGTSALKVDASQNQAHAAIIEFPASGKTGRPRHASASSEREPPAARHSGALLPGSPFPLALCSLQLLLPPSSLGYNG